MAQLASNPHAAWSDEPNRRVDYRAKKFGRPAPKRKWAKKRAHMGGVL